MSDHPVRTEWGQEMKFLVPAVKAEAVLDWARSHLRPEAGEVEAGDSPVHICSLYFDTPDLDIYYRVGKQKRQKYRARRYGEDATIALEHKTKSKGRVRERRSLIACDELPRLASGDASPGWHADWFHRDLMRWRLEPTCRLDYERLAFAGTLEGQTIRVSVDRQVHCSRASLDSLTDASAGDETHFAPVLSENIIEVRAAQALPAALKTLLLDLHLAPRGLSKYRLGMEACGLVSPAERPIAAAGLSQGGTHEP